MANSSDFYKVLGISKTASDVEIKAAYRKQALQWHPDRNKSPEATAKFKEINEAYEVLSDPQKRQTYDQFGPSAFASGQGQGGNPFAGGFSQGPFTYTYSTSGENPFESFGGFSDPFEIFEQFFGGGFSPSGGQRQARRQAYQIEISFLEAVKGAQKEVEIAGRSMKIKIPAGVDEGSRVRFSDFDLVISVKRDKIFKRDGLDIHVNVEVDYPSAVLGTTIQAPTIDGPVTLKIPAGTQPDTLIRLRGRGVTAPNSGRVGDEYVRVKVTIPTHPTSDQKRLLEEWQNLGKKRSGWF
jgi:DnaJ-class molecular chaperone